MDLDGNDDIALRLRNFISDCSLTRCDDLFPSQKRHTYVNIALDHCSCIDYMLISAVNDAEHFMVIDPSINFSDHMPLTVDVLIRNSDSFQQGIRKKCKTTKPTSYSLFQLGWEKPTKRRIITTRVCIYTRCCHFVEDIVKSLENGSISVESVSTCIESTSSSVVPVLCSGAKAYVPVCQKEFYKFWWDEELSVLKEASVESDRIWKAVGKPRNGPIFDKRQSCRLLYRKKLRESDQQTNKSYTNDLHEALLKKDGTTFWRCWRSKFECNSNCKQVEGCVDDNNIVNKFVDHFKNIFTCNDENRAA